MTAIDWAFATSPFFGSRQIAAYLHRAGIVAGRYPYQAVDAEDGPGGDLQAPRTSPSHPRHPVYPYLLRRMTIERPNQVWCADITFVSVKRGALHFVAIMDWATRKVLSWRLSNSLHADFCVEALRDVIAWFGRSRS